MFYVNRNNYAYIILRKTDFAIENGSYFAYNLLTKTNKGLHRMLTTQEVRSKFCEYFKKLKHAHIPSSSVVPLDDPSLLFTNAGMNQFKDVFLGKSIRDYNRAVSCQKCIRAGGKHNDLENVGHTARHLTFFEMLGNFSFGDYFKKDAIDFAWSVSTEIFKIPDEKIFPTVFEKDDEAFELWTKYVPAHKITKMGEKDNFWSMGETGPCGPCTELYYDLGKEFGDFSSPLQDTEGNRFLEFWNLVFMQFNKKVDGTQELLPKPSVDTGAGLERVMCLIQGKESLFEIDLMRHIISGIEKVSKKTYDFHDPVFAPCFRVIADHLRCLAFAISDGAQPGNIERGYVLRKVLRRAVRYGKQLGFDRPFLSDILPYLIEIMGPDYPELLLSKTKIEEIFEQEEEAFFRTLKRGGNLLNQIVEESKAHHKVLSGNDAFKLKDTYGLPFDEILLFAKDYGFSVDTNEYERLEKEAKEKSKAAHKEVVHMHKENVYLDFLEKHAHECTFIRNPNTPQEAKILGLLVDGQFVDALNVGQVGIILTDKTPFYAEMGGQVGDTGKIFNDRGTFTVTDCTSPYKGIIAHVGKLESGVLSIKDHVVMEVDFDRRQKIANNHTATHILHWALRRVLGEQARQAGSIVDQNHLRFDFYHHKALTFDEIRTIEELVNEKIRQNLPIQSYEMPYQEAKDRKDIIQFFGEKYSAHVRVIDIDFSKELCGGTHTSMTGNIGYFRLEKESSIAQGIRRIEAITGKKAEEFSYLFEDRLHKLADKLKIVPAKLEERFDRVLEEAKEFEKELKNLQKHQLHLLAKSLEKNELPSKLKYCVQSVTVSSGLLKTLADELAKELPTGVIALLCIDNEKAHLLIRVSSDLIQKGIKANELLQLALKDIEGNGGGKPDSAQGAGKNIQNSPKALNTIIAHLS